MTSSPGGRASGSGESPAERRDKRAQSPYTSREKLLRVFWWYFGQTIFRLTFHNWYGVRSSLLRLFGARIGPNVRLRPSVRIEQPWNLSIGEGSSVGDRATLYCLGQVTIGRGVSIAQNAHLCAGTHDFSQVEMQLLKPPIEVGDDAWVAADAFVGPGVRIGAGAILGARGCAFRDLRPWMIYGGNPARELRERPRFHEHDQAETGGAS